MKKRSRKRDQPPKRSRVPRASRVLHHEVFPEQKFKTLFELTGDMAQIFKADGTFLELNPAWRQNLEYSDHDLANLSVYNILLPKDRKGAEGLFLAVLRDGKPRRFHATFVGKGNREVEVEGTVGRLLRGDRPCALVAVFRDVTRLKYYEELKDEFISTVSHELRTPLTIVREGVAQVRDGLLGPVPEGQKTLLDIVLQSSDRLGRIIEELLDVSKLEAGKVRLHRKLHDIAAVATEVVGDFGVIAKQRNLTLVTDFIPGKIEIYIDRDKIIQVLTNFINNSLKFTTEGHVKVSLRALNGFVECKVSDTGKGISKEDLAKAFQKFQQFGREVGPGDRGTGLGLSISKRLIELHHGDVKIESVPMKGTTVTFRLPQYTHRDLFKEAIGQAMDRCREEESPLSIIIFDILHFDELERRMGLKQAERMILRMEQIINTALRRVADIAIKNTKAIMVLLPDTQKESAYLVMGRLSQVLEDFLAAEQKALKIKIRGSVVCFPEESKTLDEILDGIYA